MNCGDRRNAGSHSSELICVLMLTFCEKSRSYRILTNTTPSGK